MQKKAKTRAETAPAAQAVPDVASQVAVDLGVSAGDVRVDGDVIVLSGEAAEQAEDQGWVAPEPEVEEVDDTNGGEDESSEPLLTLSQYARLKNFNAFREGRLGALAGVSPRRESEWTAATYEVGG